MHPCVAVCKMASAREIASADFFLLYENVMRCMNWELIMFSDTLLRLQGVVVHPNFSICLPTASAYQVSSVFHASNQRAHLQRRQLKMKLKIPIPVYFLAKQSVLYYVSQIRLAVRAWRVGYWKWPKMRTKKKHWFLTFQYAIICGARRNGKLINIIPRRHVLKFAVYLRISALFW